MRPKKIERLTEQKGKINLITETWNRKEGERRKKQILAEEIKDLQPLTTQIWLVSNRLKEYWNV